MADSAGRSPSGAEPARREAPPVKPKRTKKGKKRGTTTIDVAPCDPDQLPLLGDAVRLSSDSVPHSNPRFVHEFDRATVKATMRKMFGMLTVKFAVCVIAVVASTTSYFAGNTTDPYDTLSSLTYVAIAAISVALAILGLMSMCSSLGKMFPFNHFCFELFTLCAAYLLAILAAYYNTYIVLHALCLLLVILVSQFIYACLPWGGYSHWWAVAWCIFVVGVTAMIVMLPDPDLYTWQWNWFAENESLRERDQAFEPIGVWITLAIVLFSSIYMTWQIYTSSKFMEPKDWALHTFWIFFATVFTFGVIVKSVAFCSFSRYIRVLPSKPAGVASS